MDRMVRCWSDRTPASLFFWVLTTISNETQHDTIERKEMKFKHHNASPLVTSRISHHVDEACIRLGCFVCSVGRGLDHARKTQRCFQATGGRALFRIIYITSYFFVPFLEKGPNIYFGKPLPKAPSPFGRQSVPPEVACKRAGS